MTEPGHLDLDGLADHLAGEVDASRHLATCSGCTARLSELAGADHLVLAALRSLTDLPLPADVADRLSTALAAEPPLTGEPPSTGEPLPTGERASAAPLPAPTPTAAREATVVPLDDRRRRRAWVPAAAAGLVLAAGGLIGYAVVTGRQGSVNSSTVASGAADEAAGSGARARFPTVASGLDYSAAASVAAALPTVLDGTADAGRFVAAPSPAAPDPAAAQPPAASTVDPLARLRDPVALADCLAAVLDPADPAEQPLALDYAAYQGRPALAVFLPDPDPGRLSVFVVGPACSRADGDVRFFTRLVRP